MRIRVKSFTGWSALILLALVALLSQGCGGGGVSNVLSSGSVSAGTSDFTTPVLADRIPSQLADASTDTVFITKFFGGTTIATSGATYVGFDATNTQTCIGACHKHDTQVNNFRGTAHFSFLRNEVNNDPSYNKNCLYCHTVDGPKIPVWTAGATTPTRTTGAFGMTPFNYSNSTPSVVVNTAMGGIQCENCHGPASLHIAGNAGAGDKNFIVTGSQAMNVSICDTCHDAPTHHTKSQEWRRSAHADTNFIDVRRASCAPCHSGDGFVEFTNRLATASVEITDGKGTIGKPQHAVNCQTCHDPHVNGNDAQLRLAKDQLCITCHNGRKDVPGASRLPHHNQQGRILNGEAGMTTDGKMFWATGIAPTATTTAHPNGVTTTAVVYPATMGAATCPDCHMHNADHDFVVNPAACNDCHAGMNGGAVIAAKQAAYQIKWDAINARLTNATAAHTATPFTGANLTLYMDARQNITLVDYDGSKSFHNAAYVDALLDNASAMLTKIGF